MRKQEKFNQHNSRLILEELEERRLFSGGIEGLIQTQLDSDENAIYADIEVSKAQNQETSGAVSGEAAEQQSQEIVFVDAGVDNHQQLVDDLLANSDSSRNIEVVVLDRDQDGIEQISATLQGRDDLDAIHIISHGSDGSVELGNSSLNADTLEQNSLNIALWTNSFAETGDILIYGCNLAASEVGQSLITDLGALTLTDVAASDDATGHESLGGDWDLEYHAGEIDAEVAPGAGLQARYQHILAVINGTTGDDLLNGTAGDDVISGDAGNDVLVSGGGNDQMYGEADDDVFRFTGAQDGDVITVDGGTGTDTIDLSGYASTAVTFGDGTMTIDMGGGQSFTVNYANIGDITFSDVSATVLSGNYADTGFSGTGLFIEGGQAFQVSASGGGSIDWSYDAATDAVTISDTTGTGTGTAIAITDLNGADLAVDQVTIDLDVGSLTSNVDIGTIHLVSLSHTITTVTIGGGSGTIGSFIHDGEIPTSTTINANVTSFSTGEHIFGDLTINGDVGSFLVGNQLQEVASVVITGDVGTLTVNNHVKGSLQVDGDVTTVSLKTVMATANVTFGGDVGSITVTEDIQQDITIAGDLDSLVATVIDPVLFPYTITASQVDGGLVFDVNGTDHGGTYESTTLFVFDGSTGTATTTIIGPTAAGDTIAIDENTVNSTTVATVSATGATEGRYAEMYWADKVDNAIYKASADGTGGTTTVVSGLNAPVGVEVDYNGGKLYWTTNVAGNASVIQSANLDGSGLTTLVTGLTDPDSIALDLTNGKLYWTDDTSGEIRRANLDGSAVEIVLSGLTNPESVALDVAGGKMYWTDHGDLKIQRANLDGTGIEDLVTTGLSNVGDVELDLDNGKMYWIDGATQKIQRANLDGTGVEDLVTSGLNDAYYLALDVTAGKMYWTDDGDNIVQRANLDGTGIEDLVTTGVDDPRDVALSAPATLSGPLSYSITAGNTGNAFAIDANTGEVTVADSNALDFETTPVFNLTVEVQDTLSLLTDTATITVTLNNVDDIGVNDAPENTVPVDQTIEQDGMLLFSSTTGTSISISDLDAGASLLEVTLNATNGSLNLSGTRGLSFSAGDGIADTTMTFTGTITDINSALEGATFIATAGYTGAANVQIVTNDLGNTGTGGALSDTDNVAITVAVPDHTLWMTFENDEAATGNAELSDFTGGDIVNYGGTLTFESGTTSGSFSKNFNLDLIAGSDGDTRVDAVHYVTRDLSVGSIDLQAGDLIMSTAGTEIVDGDTYTSADVFVFRPTTAGDYSAGSFFMLIAGTDSGLFGNVTGISLVEQQTTLGDVTLNVGDFLIAHDGSTTNIDRFEADELGATTSGTVSMLVKGNDIDIGQNIGALHLVQQDTAIGDTSLLAGQLMVGLVANDNAVGDAPTISVLRQDLFLLDVTATGDGTSAATATRFFEGLDENLDSNNESIWGISAQYNVTPTATDAVFAIDENSANATVVGTVTATDPENGVLTYAITSGNTGGAFTIDASSGQITVRDGTLLDHETQKVFNLTVAAIDDKGAYDSASVTIDVNNLDEAGINDAPENIVPADRIIDRNGILLFSTATGTQLAVTDFDIAANSMQVTLTATNGTINLARLQGLSFSLGDGSDDATMTFTGTLTDINAALEGATFVAATNFVGAASLQIVTDDQGGTGTGGPQSDTDLITIQVQPREQSLWLTFENDFASTGNADIPSITGGDVVTYGDITQAETSDIDPLAAVTAGSFGYQFNLDLVAGTDGNTRVDSVHFVNRNLMVGGIQLNAGDLLLSNDGDEVIDGVTYGKEDVFVFRPDSEGDYGSGSFFMLIDGSDIGLGKVTGITLVAKDTQVGDVTLNQGDILLAHDGSGNNIIRFEATSLGDTTSGGTSILIQGADVGIDQKIAGLQLIDTNTVFGGKILETGQLLISLKGDDASVGNLTPIDVKRQDIFVLNVTATGAGTSDADASRLFEGLDESLDDNRESIQGIGLQFNAAPRFAPQVLDVDENSAPATVVGTVTASDSNGDDVHFAILSGNDGDSFQIDAITGQITVQDGTLLDHETQKVFYLSVAAIDDFGAARTTTITVDINNLDEAGTNDSPENWLPADQTINEDGMLVFSSSTGTAISISDFDDGGSPVEVTLNATNGTLNLSGTQGLSFSVGDGSADTAMTFTGTLTDINAALEGATFVATPGFTGSAGLQIITDDQGNTGTGGALTDTDNLVITVQSADLKLWMTFQNDQAATGNGDIPSIAGGDVVTFGDITQLETSNTDPLASTTSGTLAYGFNLDTVLLSDGVTPASDGNTIVDAVHLVTRDIQVGSNNIQLQNGDILLSTDANEKFDGVTYGSEDLFVFRPDTPGDYSQGSFFLLIDGSDVGLGNVTGISLVEQDTVVGGVTLNAGEFLIAHDGSGKNIDHFVAGTLGDVTTGSASVLIAGGDIDIGQDIGGLLLVQNDTVIGGSSVTAGQLLVSLKGNDTIVGDVPTIDVKRQDIFVLDVTATGSGTTTATATRFFEGLDQNLDNNNESIWGIGYQGNAGPTIDADTFALDENSAGGTVVGSVTAADPELGVLQYAITAGNIDGAFAIDAATGQITVANSAALDFETNKTFSLTVAAIDPQGAYGTATVTINLNNLDEAGVNDAPENTLPADQTIGQDGMLLFSSSTSTAISISDFDDGGSPVEVTLNVTNGTLNLSGTQGLVFSVGDGSADTNMTFTGTIADINAALEGATFVVTPGFTGGASLQITTDDQGNTGTGGPLTDTDSLNISVLEVEKLWLTFANDEAVTGNSDIPTITGGDVVTFFDITQLETSDTDPLASTTSGSLAYSFNLDTVLLSDGETPASDGDTRVGAVHYVTRDIQVGSNNIQLLDGDILLATDAGETIGGVIYAKEDLFVFRPDTPGDYSQGSFFMLIDGSDVGLGKVTGISLVEQDTVVGGVTLNAGEFLLAHDGSTENIDHFVAGSLGDTTTGTASVLIAGADIDFGQRVSGLHLLHNDTVIGGTPVTAGQLLVSLKGEDTVVGDAPTIDVLRQDIFVLDVTATGVGTTAATASRFFEGLDLNFDSNNEDISGIGYQGNAAPTINADVFAVDENSVNGTVVGSVTAAEPELDTLSYAITAGNANGAFAIDAATGQITVANSLVLDFETTPIFNLTVAAIDPKGAYDTATVTVNLNDMNEAPVNSVPGAQTVSEDTSLGITGISVNDVDGNLATTQVSVSNGSLNVSLAGGATISGGANDSNTLTLSGTQAEINAALASLSYQGNSNFNGSDTLTILSTDSDGTPLSDSDDVAITVTAVNDAPVNSVPGAQTVSEDTSLGITGISVNDVDGNLATTQVSVSNGSLNVSLAGGATISGGANDSNTLTLSGTQAEINAALASLSYQGNSNFNGSDTLTILSTDSDGTPLSDSDDVAITVNQVDDAGTFAGDVAATTDEDTGTSGTVTFADTADGFTTANFSLNTAASNGVAAIDAAGNWTYTPTANYNGADSFIVEVTDDDGNVETQTINITVNQVDDAGTFAGDVAATTDEDTGTSGTVTFADTADGFTTANFSLNTPASNGVAAIDAAGNWTYTPNAHYNGADSFIVEVTDDDGNVETQTINITVNQVDDAGTFAGDVSATTDEDTGTSGTATFADTADGFTTANFSINTAASNGVAAIDAAGNWTYTPNANYNGADSFIVEVTDDDGNVETQVVSITVTQIDDTGSFGGNTSATTNEDTATAGTVTFSDTADGFTTANFSLNTPASNGVAAIDAAGNWTYTPTANYNGADSFTVQVTDDDGNVETQVISLTVTQIDDTGSFGGNTSATTNEDTATAGTVTFADTADGFTTPNFSINTAASNGVAAIDAAGNWTYTPTANYNGADSFTVQVTDDDGNVETQVISLTVTQIDDTGTFGGDTSATTNEDTATGGTVTFADTADGFTTANFSLNTAASNGVAAIDAAGNWTYTPNANYNGADSFIVEVTDDDGNVETQVISLTVTQIDDTGSFGGNTSATTNEDTATAGTVTFADTADGFTTPNFSLNTAASNGVAAIDAAGNWTYTPTANYNGADSFTVQVTDDDGNVETQVVSITVTQIDDTGSFGGNTSATTNEDTATAGTVTFADTADGFTTPNFSINTAASNGVAAIDAAGNWTYTPTANYNGADSFTVQVTDDDGNVETQVISLTVTQIDDTGTFGGNTSATTNEDTATGGTVTFADTADGFTTANFSINTAASNGVAAIDAAGNWTYTPTANYNGADSFTVQVTDDDGNVETQVISLTVTQIDDTGTFGGNTSATTNEDTATGGTVTFADTADGFTTANFSINTAASNGVAAIDAAGNWTYTPTANYNGADSFTVQVTDDDGNVETQVVSITVTQIDDTGSFGGNTSATTNEDTATAGTVTFSDTADGFTTANFSINTAASNGVAAIDAAGNWTYTPTANYNGADSFVVEVTDDDGNVETQVISLTVTQIDDTGTFGGDTSATTNEDTATGGTVTFADTADGFTTANFSLNTPASNGVAAIDAAGNWTYTPNANYNGADSFIVEVTDDDGNVETQVVSITVTQIDDTGSFGGNTSATTNEDTATAGTVTFADTADGFTTPNFSLNTAASNGVAAIDAAGNWTYTPTANYNGADSFTVQVTDDDGNVETQVVSITVTQIDDTGSFGGNTSATTNEDTATAGTVTFSDTADGFTTANFSINTAASNGVAAIDAAGNWTYTPTANYNGADSFTVQVTDDDGNVETQVVSITVTQIDDTGSFGGNTSATTNEDTATAGTVTFADAADGFTTPNFSLNTAASNGVAAIDAAGNWTYTPTANYNGADSFTVQVTDDDGNVETQVISLTITQIDDTGTFGGDVSATTDEDTGTSGTVTFADTADGFTTANFSLNTAASNGVAAIDAAGNWTYTPTANYNGADSFTVQVTDDDGNVETQVISLTVTQIDDTGTFGGDTSATTNEDTATGGTVTFADAADDFTTANFSINTAASNGVAAIDAAGNWTYTPTANYNGADSFTVQVTDDDGNVETQVISLTVTQIDDTGTFGGDTSATTNEDTATAGTVTFADTADGFTTANFSINTAASNGVAAIDAAGNWTYTPNANYNGADSFTVQVTDDDGNVETQVISLTVTQIDDTGSFGGNTSATTNEDTATAGTVTFSDTADGFTTANFSINTAASNGVAAIDAAGNWTYTPTVNYNGADSFTVQVTDDDGNIETQVVSITVTQIDDTGSFGGNTSATTNEDTATAGTVTFSDTADGFTTANFSINTAASNGVAAIDAAGNWTYTPTANYNGADSFTVQVTDDDGNVETQVISLTVTQIDDTGSFGGNTSATTNEDTGTSGTVTFADTADGFTTPNFSLNTAASNGVAAIDAAGNWTYTPTANYNGADSFTVQVTDDDGNVETQVVSITVTQIDDTGSFGGNTSATTNEDTATAGTVTFADTADGFTTANFSINTAASNGVAAIDAAGNWTYTPNANYNGADSFTVQVTDDDGNVETQVISLTVTQIDDIGSFGGNTSATTNEDTATAGTVTFADTADGFTTANFSLNTAASNGVAAIDAAGNWTYTPNANYNGADSFTVQVTDDDGNVETQTINITVTQIDDTGTFGGDTSATTNEDTATAGTVTFADTADGFTTANFSINTAASNGVAAIDAAGNWTYTPSANYNGADSFTVQVTDDDGNVETQVISLTVTQIDDTGTFGGDTSATTNEDTATGGTVTFADAADGFTTANFSINTAASNGVAAIDAAGNWTYTPTANYNGADSFTVQVTDDDGNVETQVISLTVTQIDDTGTFGGDTSATTNEDTATGGTVTFADAADGFTTANFSINTAASNGVAAIDAAGNWTYTPTANYNGADSFTVQVTDDDGNVETQVISLTVTQIDDTGTFGGDTAATTNEDTATAGTVTFADAADGFTTANFSINTVASNGVAAIDAAGNWTYTPTANYNGADSFTVQVTDDDGNVETQTINITVTQIDDTGTFGGDTSATTNEDTATAGTVTFADTADGFTTANFSLNTAASNGVAAIDAAGNWTYTPNANYNGADSFIVEVTDDDGNVETHVISLTVTQIDDTGTFGGDTSATTNEDTATGGTVTFADAADGFTTANFSINTAASNGVAAIDAAGNWTYTPTANYNGADSFIVEVTDDDGNVETQVISLTVTQIDDTGTFGGDTAATTNEDTATAGTVTFADTADGFTTANFSINTAASNGVAAIDAAGNWTYTPSANYNGADSFTVQVTDDDGNIATQVISLTVTQIDDTGTFGGDTSATTNEDTATGGTVTFADAADGFTTANFSINTAASNGVAAIDAAGNWTYTPNAHYNGADSFVVEVTDDDGNVETRTINITVNQVDDAGTFAGDVSATTAEDTGTSGTVTFADTADGFTTANFSINTAASNGVAAIDAAGNWTYTPTANYHGADSFVVEVTDDDGNVETRTINITVNQVDDAGTFAGDVAATTDEDTATAGTVTFADTADGFTTANFSLNTAASNGVATIDAAGNWTYTPNAHYNGADSFVVEVTDDDGNVETRTINITVNQVDDAGTFAGDVSATTDEDTGTSGTVTFADTADGFTTANFSINTAASNGVAAIDAAGNWTYTPTANYNGADSFTVQVTDDDGNVETRTINITISQVDDAGTFGGNLSGTAAEGGVVTGTLTATDVDGLADGTYFTVTGAAPANGTAAINPASGAWTFTPTDPDWFGSDSFEVTLTDDEGGTTTQIISVTLTNTDDAASIGGNLSGSAAEGVAVTGTLTATDLDGLTDGSYFTVTGTLPINGTAAINPASGAWTFTPTDPDWFGSESFEVTVTDDQGGTTTQVINVTLINVNDPAVFGGDITGSANEGVTVTGTLTATDVDGLTDGTYFTVTGTLPSNGTAAIDPVSGAWTFTPTDPDWVGSDSFEVTVTDDVGNTTTRVINVTLINVDDAPVIGGADTGSVSEDVAVVAGNISTSGSLTIADPDAGESSFVAATINGLYGDLVIDAAGNWQYRADNGQAEIQFLQAGDTLADTLAVTTADGNTHEIVITINGKADAAPDPSTGTEPPVKESPPDEETPPAEEDDVEVAGGGTKSSLDEIVRIPQGTPPPPPSTQQDEVDQVFTGAQEVAQPVNYGPEIDKREVQKPLLANQPALLLQNLNLETLDVQVSDDELLNERYENEFLDRIDRMHQGMDSDGSQQLADDVEVQIIMGSTVSLTAGIVSWVLRGGSLLASFMSTVPLLNRFDPLPILKAREDEEDVEPDDDTDTEIPGNAQARKVDKMFSGKGNARQ